jgi:quercetin dioxygenase-like cupin family protein
MSKPLKGRLIARRDSLVGGRRPTIRFPAGAVGADEQGAALVNISPNAGKSFWLTTDRHTLKLVSSDTNGAFTLIETSARPEFGPPPHIHHRQDECFYVLEGSFEFTYEGRTFTAGAGSIVQLLKGRVHTHRAAGSGPARALVLYTPAGLEEFIEEAGTPVVDQTAIPAPPTLPDLGKIVAIASKYGIEVPPPPSAA